MKNILFFLFFSLPVVIQAQVKVDRSKAPKPGPAPIIKVGEPASFVLENGLKVFVVQNSKLPRVVASLTIDRDALLEGDKAGVVAMAGELMRRGTTGMNKASLDESIDFLGANISATANSIIGGSLKTNFEKTFSLMADIALRPSFPSEELEKIRKQTLSAIALSKDDANAIAKNVSNKLLYGANHPYGELQTETTVNKVSVADIKNYYQTYWKPNIAYLIFVGDITLNEAKRITEQELGAWKKGAVPELKYATPVAPSKTYIAIVDRPSSVQSVINITAPISLLPGAKDEITASMMNALLGSGSTGRLYKNLREKYAFTYGAYSNLESDKLVGNFSASASVRNEKTDSAIGQFFVEFHKIRNELIAATDIARSKNEISGTFARSLESPATIASFALNIARYQLPKDYYQNYLKNLASITQGQIMDMAKKYILPTQMHIVIVGNAKEIAKGLEKYGEIKYFDNEGNPKAAPSTQSAAITISAETILLNAIKAQGTEQAINAIKDIQLKGAVSVMNQNLEMNVTYVLPSGYLQTLSMAGMNISKQLKNGNTYAVSQQGMEAPLTEKDKEELSEAASFFVEKYLLEKGGYQFKVVGIESVNGQDAYQIAITSPQGRVLNYFYDIKSGLRVKESITKESPAGNLQMQTYYLEYKTIQGVQIPMKILLDMGQMKLNQQITEVKLNSGLTLDSLK